MSYCIEPAPVRFSAGLTASIAGAVQVEAPEVKLAQGRARVRRCCFAGSIQLPPDETAGMSDVHLTVQNINPTPEGTPPEQAATTIGGHLLSTHAAADVLGCTVVMLLDHVFDVI